MSRGLFDHPLFEFGFSLEPFALVALLLSALCGGLAFAAQNQRFLARLGHIFLRPQRRVRHRLLLAAVALGAAFLSLLYFKNFLGGGPRIIDGAAYLLEARTFATGSFTFRPPAPSDLFLGRFLLRAAPSPADIGVIFPPGYPAVLAWFALLDVPFLLGPLLALGIVLTTYQLTLRLGQAQQDELGLQSRRTPGAPERWAPKGSATASNPRPLTTYAPLVAATFSALSMTLRYHTAEPMSHGLTTLLTAILFWLGLGGLERVPLVRSGLFGLGAGLLFATRPLTCLAVFVGLAVLGRKRLRALGFSFGQSWSRPAALLLGALPGLLLYAFYQRALTGSYFGSAQLSYYQVSDGPGSCFGLGFGKGCAFEHGDVLEERGPLGPLWALLNSLHRLHQHSLDIANFELLALGLAYFLWRERSSLKSRLTFATLGSLVFFYAFFYFDGSYPGGGARFLVEALPLEHACLGLLATSRGVSLAAIAISLFGFSTHGIFSHVSLRERDGGAPFLSDEVARAPEKRIVFVKSDHAFLSGFDPRALEEGGHSEHLSLKRTLIARQSHDAREGLLVSALGYPAAFRTLREPGARGKPNELERLPTQAPNSPSPIRAQAPIFEAERAWPPLKLEGAWGHPVFRPEACLSGGAGLSFWPDAHRPGPASLQVWLDIPTPSPSIRLCLWSRPRGCFSVVLPAPPVPGPLAVPLADWMESSHGASSARLAPSELVLDRWEFVDDEELPSSDVHSQ